MRPTEVLPLIVRGSETIWRLKRLIEYRYGFPADKQRLTIDDMILQDDRRLNDYGYELGSKLIVILDILPQTTRPSITSTAATTTTEGMFNWNPRVSLYSQIDLVIRCMCIGNGRFKPNCVCRMRFHRAFAFLLLRNMPTQPRMICLLPLPLPEQ